MLSSTGMFCGVAVLVRVRGVSGARGGLCDTISCGVFGVGDISYRCWCGVMCVVVVCCTWWWCGVMLVV